MYTCGERTTAVCLYISYRVQSGKISISSSFSLQEHCHYCPSFRTDQDINIVIPCVPPLPLARNKCYLNTLPLLHLPEQQRKTIILDNTKLRLSMAVLQPAKHLKNSENNVQVMTCDMKMIIVYIMSFQSPHAVK